VHKLVVNTLVITNPAIGKERADDETTFREVFCTLQPAKPAK